MRNLIAKIRKPLIIFSAFALLLGPFSTTPIIALALNEETTEDIDISTADNIEDELNFSDPEHDDASVESSKSPNELSDTDYTPPNPHTSQVATGTIGVGGAPWRLYDDGTVIVEGGIANGGINPWNAYNTIITRIVFTEPILGGADLSNLFSMMWSLAEIENLAYFDTSNVTNMSNLFRWTAGLTSLDVGNWNTSNVIDMNNMFSGASGLTSLDVSNWNTSNVINMNSLFEDVGNLISLDVSNWDTSNVTDMFNMFADASALVNLDLSGFDTRNVTNMDDMFARTIKLRQLTLGEHWQTVGNPALPTVPSNVTYTGRWQNIGNGTIENPQGIYALTPDELMNANDTIPPVVDTWVWQRISQIVTFESSGNGTVTPAETPVLTEDTIGTTLEITTTAATDSEFSHWTSDVYEGTFTTAQLRNLAIPEDTTFTAVFKLVNHPVTFALHGGIETFPPQIIEHGDFATAPESDPTRVDYTFLGWFTAANEDTPFDFETPIEANTVIHAQWIADTELDEEEEKEEKEDDKTVTPTRPRLLQAGATAIGIILLGGAGLAVVSKIIHDKDDESTTF